MDILWVGDVSLLFAPSALEVTIILHFLRVLDGQPAWSLDLSLQDEEFKHTLTSSEETLKSVSRQICWQRGHRGWIFDLQEFVFTV